MNWDYYNYNLVIFLIINYSNQRFFYNLKWTRNRTYLEKYIFKLLKVYLILSWLIDEF